MKKCVMYFDRMKDVHLYKDVGMVPLVISKILDYDLTYITSEKISNYAENKFKIKHIKRFPTHSLNLHFFFWLIKEARSIDLLMTIHCRWYTLLIGFIYKIRNPKGVYYIKADQNLKRNVILNEIVTSNYELKPKFLMKILKKRFVVWVYSHVKYVDLISFEQRDTLAHVMEHGLGSHNVSNKIVLLENGIYVEDSQEIRFKDKENIVITTGRIGAKGKNHEFLLEVIKNIDIKDWAVYFVGPVEESFVNKVEQLKLSNPELKNRIILTGNITSRKKLFSYYSKSKVFVFTSEAEGYPLVFPEAAYFGNYIITTDVGGAKEITKNQLYGKIIEQGDKRSFIEHLQYVLDNDHFLEKKIEELLTNRDSLKWNDLLLSVIFKIDELVQIDEKKKFNQ